jgi:hypothetical protein
LGGVAGDLRVDERDLTPLATNPVVAVPPDIEPLPPVLPVTVESVSVATPLLERPPPLLPEMVESLMVSSPRFTR